MGALAGLWPEASQANQDVETFWTWCEGAVGHVDAPSLETFNVRMDGALSNLI